MGSAKKLQRRGAPRFRFRDEQKSFIRFTSNVHRDIHTTKIFDISSTGLSFICSKRLAPRIGIILKMEFSPAGGVQMAVLGRVMRIEDPREHSDWARFPGTVKIGVQFQKLPRQYIKLITEIIAENVSDEEMKRMVAPVYLHPKAAAKPRGSTWFEENIWNVAAGLMIVAAAAVLFYILVDPTINTTKPTEAPWASNFFNKVITKPGQ